jgi:hypothetical protein
VRGLHVGWLGSSVAAAVALLLAGCVTPRLHSPLELADVAVACSVPVTDVAQEASLKKLLFLYTPEPSLAQLHCVHQWARKHHLRLAYIEAVEHQKDQAGP